MTESGAPPVQPVHLVVDLGKGMVILPSWLAVLFLGLFVLASVGLLLVWGTIREEVREIRVLELHVQDVESVLIQSGIAHRRDFAVWGPDSAPAARPDKPGEK